MLWARAAAPVVLGATVADTMAMVVPFVVLWATRPFTRSFHVAAWRERFKTRYDTEDANARRQASYYEPFFDVTDAWKRPLLCWRRVLLRHDFLYSKLYALYSKLYRDLALTFE